LWGRSVRTLGNSAHTRVVWVAYLSISFSRIGDSPKNEYKDVDDQLNRREVKKYLLPRIDIKLLVFLLPFV